jgi:hypothetical protein
MNQMIAALCAVALLAGCAGTRGDGKGGVGLGLSVDERDAITRADRDCDRAGTSAATDPSNHCFIRKGKHAAN